MFPPPKEAAERDMRRVKRRSLRREQIASALEEVMSEMFDNERIRMMLAGCKRYLSSYSHPKTRGAQEKDGLNPGELASTLVEVMSDLFHNERTDRMLATCKRYSFVYYFYYMINNSIYIEQRMRNGG